MISINTRRGRGRGRGGGEIKIKSSLTTSATSSSSSSSRSTLLNIRPKPKSKKWWKYLFLSIVIALSSLSVHLILQIRYSNSATGYAEYGNNNNDDMHVRTVTDGNDGVGGDGVGGEEDITNKYTKTNNLKRNNNNQKLKLKSNTKQEQQRNKRSTIKGKNDDDDDDERPLLRQKYLQHLRTLPPLPHHLHIIFPHKNYYKRPSSSHDNTSSHEQPPVVPFVQHTIIRFMEQNPTWNVTVYDDDDMDGLIGRGAVDGLISMEEKWILVGNETTPASHPVERADLARMLIMWYYGGLYVDADALQNPKNFTKTFSSPSSPSTIKLCLPIYLQANFAQSILCSSPHNRLHIEIIQAMSHHRMKSNNGNGQTQTPLKRIGGWAHSNELFSMGPPLYNRLVFRIVFGISHRGMGDIEGIEEYMKVLKEEASDLIVTGQYLDSCHSFLAEPYEGCEERDRSELYGLYNMSSWGKAVRRRWGLEK